ncbi:enoyl-CoA hydratase [Thermoleophilia bacterium SCSIO 60948]|nr:enoyl-CoA hydratase [Thermoleophilia bacterium SCSIO 60948]
MSDSLAGGKLLLDRPADCVARLTLSDPERPNPLGHDVLDAISELLPWLGEGIDTRCLVIRGSGGVFSAGYDIGSIPDDSFATEAEALVAHPFAEAMEAISDFPYPVIASIEGACLGGGLELAVRCDLRLVAGGARLGMPPAKLGLVYGHTGLERFIDVVGVAATRELFLTGRNLAPSEALRIGLVNRICEPHELEAATVELAADIASNAPLSMRGNKRAIEVLRTQPLDEDAERELIELRQACFRSHDLREGIRAFAEKREPRWEGR